MFGFGKSLTQNLFLFLSIILSCTKKLINVDIFIFNEAISLWPKIFSNAPYLLKGLQIKMNDKCFVSWNKIKIERNNCLINFILILIGSRRYYTLRELRVQIQLG